MENVDRNGRRRSDQRAGMTDAADSLKRIRPWQISGTYSRSIYHLTRRASLQLVESPPEFIRSSGDSRGGGGATDRHGLHGGRHGAAIRGRAVMAHNAMCPRLSSSYAVSMAFGRSLPSWSAISGLDAANRAAMTRERTGSFIGGIRRLL